MTIVGYGGGTNSTAMLVGLWQRQVPVDLILFADPGGEQPHTYEYLEIMERWLLEHGMPPITRVWYTTKDGERLTLEQECLRSGSLPSIAYGHKKCSLKHKVTPQEKFCNHHPGCRDAWAKGEKVVKLIGYPPLISQEQFDAVQSRRQKQSAPLQKTPAQKELRRLCGGSPPPWVERQVLAVLNDLIARPEQLRCPLCEKVLPAEVIRLRQELDDLLNTPPVDEDRARKMALHLAELQLNTIGPEEYETERLQRLFQSRSPMSELNQELLHESVRHITYAGRRVTILLKNHQTMEGGNNQ